MLVENVFVASVWRSQEAAVDGADCTSKGMECIALVNTATVARAFGIPLLNVNRILIPSSSTVSPCC